MKRKNKVPMLLLVIAAALLVASSVGSTQAALVITSNEYKAEVDVNSIGVALIENGKELVAENDRVLAGQPAEVSSAAQLFGNIENIEPGVSYKEELQVKNTGTIDTYVRVIITKYWAKDGVKSADHAPEYIKLGTPAHTAWVKDEEASRADEEREIYYYTNMLAAGAVTPEALTSELCIDTDVLKELKQETADNVVTYSYVYDNCSCVVEVEVQAVQARNAEDAIKSAWGVDVTVTDGKLSI